MNPIREHVVRALVATGRFSEQAARAGERAGYRCTYCRRDMLGHVDTYHRLWEHDHIVPRHAGGADTEENTALCCLPCNRIKGTWDPRDMAGQDATLGELIEAVRGYVHERRGFWLGELHRVKDILKGAD